MGLVDILEQAPYDEFIDIVTSSDEEPNEETHGLEGMAVNFYDLNEFSFPLVVCRYLK